mmetsp:Transcript_36686/g.42177  ORF Transcript_36686/g.42177 Transcript_36686/m.42177 type:complete len:314 (-) Transcript_36686:281-1222(-)
MKITASLLSVFVSVGVASAGDSSSLRSIDQRFLQDSSPKIEAGNGAVTTGADMKNKDDEGFNKDTCQNIAQIACGGDFQELCDHLSTSSSTLGKELTGGSWTVFFPTDQAFRDIEDNVIEKFDDDKMNQLLLFHVIENQALKFDDLTCTEKVLMYNGKHSRTKCEYNLLESARPRTPIKHQNGSGNNKMGNKPVIIRSNVPACNGIIHIVDSLLLPFPPKLIGDDDRGGDPGFGRDPTCDPSPDCEPRYGNGQQLTFCCITDDQYDPGELIGNDDMGGDPGFEIDPNPSSMKSSKSSSKSSPKSKPKSKPSLS